MSSPTDPTLPAPPGPPRWATPAPKTRTEPAPAACFSPAPVPAGSGFDEDIRRLLRRRLIACLGIGAAGMSVMVVAAVLGEGGAVGHGAGPVAGAAFNAACALAGVATIVYLRRTPGVSLARLRAIEVTLFAVAAVGFGVFRYAAFAGLTGESPDPRFARVEAERTLAVSNLSFYFLIFFYGVVIPNTRRRGLAVVAGLAAVPFAASLAAAAANPAIRPYTGLVLGMTATGTLMSAAAAVFGASRINALQRQAFEARREAQQVGPYTLKKQLGAGGMGEVFLAEHRLLKRPCAVKFVRAEMAADPSVAQRFEREVRAVTGLTHFNTVRVYDYGRADDGSFYYVMEYLDGPTLDALVKRVGPLPPGRAVYLLRQLCGALAEAHAAGLVHRDVKPSNVIVATLGGQRDVVKVLDFGLVHDAGSTDGRLTQTGAVMGTPAYMCPEQAAGEANIDGRGDLYSLGGVAFFALTGRPPFEGTAAWQLISAHLTKTPPRADEVNPAVPADLAGVVARCLAKDPAERFQSATELDAALAACGCAGDWSAAEAARWWAAHEAGDG